MFTVQELMEAVIGYKPIAPATAKGWSYGIKGFETKLVTDIDKKFVVMRRVQLNNFGYKQGYVRTLLGYCGTIWKWAQAMGLVDNNPWEGSLEGLDKDKKSYPFLKRESYERLHGHPLFECCYYHGFRVNEIAGIQPDEIILDAEVPHFEIKPNKVRGIKNKPSIRKVPIHAACIDLVKKDFPFTDNIKAGDYFSRRMKKICGHSAHGLRHSAATRMRKAGIEYSIAAAILGHRAAGMTAGYGDILLEDMDDQLQKLR